MASNTISNNLPLSWYQNPRPLGFISAGSALVTAVALPILLSPLGAGALMLSLTATAITGAVVGIISTAMYAYAKIKTAADERFNTQNTLNTAIRDDMSRLDLSVTEMRNALQGMGRVLAGLQQNQQESNSQVSGSLRALQTELNGKVSASGKVISDNLVALGLRIRALEENLSEVTQTTQALAASRSSSGSSSSLASSTHSLPSLDSPRTGQTSGEVIVQMGNCPLSGNTYNEPRLLEVSRNSYEKENLKSKIKDWRAKPKDERRENPFKDPLTGLVVKKFTTIKNLDLTNPNPLCPVTNRLYTEPYICLETGLTYDKSSLEAVLELKNSNGNFKFDAGVDYRFVPNNDMYRRLGLEVPEIETSPMITLRRPV